MGDKTYHEMLDENQAEAEAFPIDNAKDLFLIDFSAARICFTGDMEPYDREYLRAEAEALGAQVYGSVSANTTLVVYGSSPGAKLDKARELNLPVMPVDEYMKKLRDLQSQQRRLQPQAVDTFVKPQPVVTIRFSGDKASGKTLLSGRIRYLLEEDGFMVKKHPKSFHSRRATGLTDDNLTDDLMIEAPVDRLAEMEKDFKEVFFLTSGEADVIMAMRRGKITVLLNDAAGKAKTPVERADDLLVVNNCRPGSTFSYHAVKALLTGAFEKADSELHGDRLKTVTSVNVAEGVDVEKLKASMSDLSPSVIAAFSSSQSRVPILPPPAEMRFEEVFSDPFTDYFVRQVEWSLKTFGPAARTKGILEHIRKELGEVESAPYDLMEWIDIMILAMDGYHRHGGDPRKLFELLQRKQTKNFARVWPDWRTRSEDQAIEHDRSGE